MTTENLAESPDKVENPSTPTDPRGTHASHCCVIHGCKYGQDEACVVAMKVTQQDYLCEECISIQEAEELIAELKEQIALAKSLGRN